MRVRLPVILICVVGLVSVATACDEFREFPEFRYTSALPGGGWGVTPDGIPGFDGAMQITVPVAYTPHRGLIVGGSSASYDATPVLSTGGGDANGTAVIGLGFGKSGHGLYFAEMPTSRDYEPAQNVQQQILPEGRRQPAVAVGLQDIFENRSRYLGAPKDLHNTDSPYVVATRQFRAAERPLYVTLGLGWGRFNSTAIGGVSWRASEKLTVMAEYDGFNPNAGLAYDLSDVIAEDTILFGALVDLNRAVIGLHYVYKDLPL